MLALLAASCGLGRGRQEVRALRADPVLGFRAPGTRFLGQEELPSKRDWIGEGQTTSRVVQRFELTAEPGPILEAYRQAAQASGWALVIDGCSRTARATSIVLGKAFARFAATATVLAELGGTDNRATGRLEVMLAATAAIPQSLPVDAGLERNGVDCLRGLDPADPDLQRPADGKEAVLQLCSRIPLPAAKGLDPRVEAATAVGDRGYCWFTDARGIPLLEIVSATQPRAYYLDRRLPSDQDSDQVFLFSRNGKAHTEDAQQHAVWAATPKGAFDIQAGETLGPGEESDRLAFRMAAVVGQVAAQPWDPATPPPAAPPPAGAELVDYALEGGLAGSMHVVVTTEGEAIYTRGLSEATRFRVSPDDMGELRAALAGIDFAALSPSYGRGGTPDLETEIVTYRGKAIRIASGAPPKLRRLTRVLRRILDEGRSRS